MNPSNRLESYPEVTRSGIDPDMNLSEQQDAATTANRVRPDRRIPGWAAALQAELARDRPAVVTRDEIATRLREVVSTHDVDATVRELQRLGWLNPLHVKGVWAYVPPGENEIVDPYIDLRGWQAHDPNAVFALAGEAAAWHLGYLDRRFNGPVSVWIPKKSQLPNGLRPHLSIVTLGWSAQDAARLQPTTAFLHQRRLDMKTWAAGLPGFGPEALLVQLSARPASFRVWADLVPHLQNLAGDCELERLSELLNKQSSSAWQSAAYILHCGDRHNDAIELLANRPKKPMSIVNIGTGPTSDWAPEFSVVDHLIAPLQRASGKA